VHWVGSFGPSHISLLLYFEIRGNILNYKLRWSRGVDFTQF
jgi:hypothetical protein